MGGLVAGRVAGGDRRMARLPAIVRQTEHLPKEYWHDPGRGSICWQTLISAEITPTNSLVCGVATLEIGDDFALHHHAEPEVYFGIEGEAAVSVDGEACHLAPGVAIYIPANAVHGIAAVAMKLRYFYVFAADSFDTIDYRFATEDTRPN